MATYGELKFGDEFDTIFRHRFTRCRVTSIPTIDRGIIRFSIAAASAKRYSRTTEVKSFNVSAHVDIHFDRIQIESTPQRTCDRILRILGSAPQSKTSIELGELMPELKRTSITSALKSLSKSKALIAKRKGHGFTYRLPLLNFIGFPVVENIGTRSQKLCKIIGTKDLDYDVFQRVLIVEDLSGYQWLSSDELLEPCTPILQQRYRKLEREKRSPVPVVIPEYLLRSLVGELKEWQLPSDILPGSEYAKRLMGKPRSNQMFYEFALIEIAKLFGMVGENANGVRAEKRNQLMDHLQAHHPELFGRRRSA
jgi:hypothetical protein